MNIKPHTPLTLIKIHADANRSIAEGEKNSPMEEFHHSQANKLQDAHDKIAALVEASRAIVACPVLPSQLARNLRGALEPFST